jgi:colanic acid/amylovoran biosynthesis glycosyltransferase
MTRLGIVTSGYPYTAKESFLGPELRELAAAADACVYPVNPKSRTPQAETGAALVRMPVLSARVAAHALREFVERPGAVAAAFRVLVLGRASLRVRLKNAAVFPKALAIARDMRRRGVQHVHAYWASTPASVAYAVAVLNGLPWSFTTHRWDIYEDNLVGAKLRHATFVRAISDRARTSVLEHADAAFGAKVLTLHLGVATNGGRRNGDPKRPFTLLCAANLEPVKGLPTLVEALRIVAAHGVAVRCTIAGEGSMREQIAAAIANAGLSDSVMLRGAVPHAQLLEELARGDFDAAVLASIEAPGGMHEGIPVFLMEAMAVGVPCIATNTGSIAELVDANCGILVEQRDPIALAGAIERLRRDDALRHTLGSAARLRILTDFTAADSSRRLLARIQEGDNAAMRREMSSTTLTRS